MSANVRKRGSPAIYDGHVVGPAVLRLGRSPRKSMGSAAKRKKRTTGHPVCRQSTEMSFFVPHIAIKAIFRRFFSFPTDVLCGNCIVAFRLHATDAAHALGPNAAEKTPAKKGGPQKGLRTPRRNVSRGRLATRYCNAPSLRRSVPCGQTARRNVR